MSTMCQSRFDPACWYVSRIDPVPTLPAALGVGVLASTTLVGLTNVFITYVPVLKFVPLVIFTLYPTIHGLNGALSLIRVVDPDAVVLKSITVIVAFGL